jgi:hypothetical protein
MYLPDVLSGELLAEEVGEGGGTSWVGQELFQP